MSLITDILVHYHTFAIIGVSQDPNRYGHEVFEALLKKGYKVYPINPKYEMVDGYPCYPSLEMLPEKPEVAVVVVPPIVTEKVVETFVRLGIGTMWMPPGSWSKQAVDTCEVHGIEEVHDVCPIFVLNSL